MVLHLSWVAAHQCLKGRGPIPIQSLTLQIMGQLIDQLCCFVCIFSFKLLLLCILLLCKIGIDWVNMQRTSIQYWQMTNSHGGDLHCKTQIKVNVSKGPSIYVSIFYVLHWPWDIKQHQLALITSFAVRGSPDQGRTPIWYWPGNIWYQYLA